MNGWQKFFMVLAILVTILGVVVLYGHKQIREGIGKKFLRENPGISSVVSEKDHKNNGKGLLWIGGGLALAVLLTVTRPRNLILAVAATGAGTIFLLPLAKGGKVLEASLWLGGICLAMSTLFFIFFFSPPTYKKVVGWFQNAPSPSGGAKPSPKK